MHPARQLPVQSSRCAWLIDDDSEDAVKSHVDEANDRLVKNTLVNLATRHQQVTSFERIREPHSVYCATQNQGIEARSSTDPRDRTARAVRLIDPLGHSARPGQLASAPVSAVPTSPLLILSGLVGSEMCIRDRPTSPLLINRTERPSQTRPTAEETHLALRLASLLWIFFARVVLGALLYLCIDDLREPVWVTRRHVLLPPPQSASVMGPDVRWPSTPLGPPSA